MYLSPTRIGWCQLRRELVVAFSSLVFAGATTPAHGQCLPSQLAKLIASDAAAGDFFGISVAVSGDTAVVGAYGDDDAGGGSGSAYVFVRSGGVWTAQAKLTASDATAGDEFGISVAVSGDTVLVGAYNDDHTSATDAGSAYVFVRTGVVWTQQQKLTASDAAASDQFGFSVSLSANTALVGAWRDDHTGGTDAGSAYAFVRSGVVWTQQQKLTASDAAEFDNFGISVAVSGDTAVLGAYRDDSPLSDAGSAYVVTRTGAVWTQQAKLTAFDAAVADNLGFSVALSGDTAVLGAPGDDHAGGFDAGSAYVFAKPLGGWINMTETAKLTASDAAASDYFGRSVAVSGDTAVVGARWDDHAGGTNAGSAYVSVRTGGVWTQQSKLISSDSAASDEFGYSVAISSDTALVGAHLDNHASGTDAGSAYVFLAGKDSDCDGVLDANDVCPNNSMGLPVDCTGRPLRDANNDCLCNAGDVPFIVDELLLITIPPTGCNGQPLRDANTDTTVDGADMQQIVNELLMP